MMTKGILFLERERAEWRIKSGPSFEIHSPPQITVAVCASAVRSYTKKSIDKPSSYFHHVKTGGIFQLFQYGTIYTYIYLY